MEIAAYVESIRLTYPSVSVYRQRVIVGATCSTLFHAGGPTELFVGGRRGGAGGAAGQDGQRQEQRSGAETVHQNEACKER